MSESLHPERWEFRERSVYSFRRSGVSEAVILVHELPGLSPSCIDLGRSLFVQGFTVHMPLLFGEYGQSDAVAGLRQMWCLRHEFELFRAGRTSRIVEWLRPLTDHVADGDRKVGLIGMCATGGLVLAMMHEPGVGAAVAAQPSLPFRIFWTRRDRSVIGTDPDDLQRASDSDTPLIVTRFERDPLCPANRVLATSDVFDDGGRDLRVRQFPGWRHATLTDDASHATGLFDELVGFLRLHLAG